MIYPILRPATFGDAGFLYELRNDEDVRRNSFNQEKVPYERHLEWLGNVLTDKSRHLFVAENAETKELIGQIRLDEDEEGFEISYSVAGPFRGQHAGTFMVGALMQLLVGSDARIYARVKHDNEASQKVFLKNGFSQCADTPEYIEYERIVSNTEDYE